MGHALCPRVYFNPRSRKESDASHRNITTACWNFNPRSRKESDARQTMNRLIQRSFQSTLSQGERRLLWKNWKEFNGISIHALARRATFFVPYRLLWKN